MKTIQLLDCTLRDGGYLNDWEFGHDTLVNVFERLVSSGVDIIEVGFLDDRRPFDINRCIMPNTQSVKKIFGNLDKGNTMVVGMIDFGTCHIENIQPCEESFLDGIRVIFKKHVRHEAIDFCKQLKALGYKVFVQAVSITSYIPEELMDLIQLVNEFHPYALSMVDTYGLLHQDNLHSIYAILAKNLMPDISIGYHAHNNFQMGYANGIRIIEAESERNTLIDGTLYGMGKSAGNAPIELLAMYLNENFGKQYDISQMLEAVETSILNIYQKIQWGYNIFYYVAASNKCHPSYVSYLMNKNTLSIKSINEILKRIDAPDKLMYDSVCIEKLYLDYQTCECNDDEAMDMLKRLWKDHELIVLGPGRSCNEYQKQIIECKEKENTLMISINFIPDFCNPDYLFLTNSKRYLQLSNRLTEAEYKGIPVVATSNVTKTSGIFQFELNYSRLIDADAVVQDNSLIMCMKLLLELGIDRVQLAGFDGYSATKMNYYTTNMEYSFVKEKAEKLNQYAKSFFYEHRACLDVGFITPSCYQE